MSKGESANSIMFRHSNMGSSLDTGASSASSPLAGSLTASIEGKPQKSGPFPGLRVMSSLVGAISSITKFIDPESLSVVKRVEIGRTMNVVQKVPGIFNTRGS